MFSLFIFPTAIALNKSSNMSLTVLRSIRVTCPSEAHLGNTNEDYKSLVRIDPPMDIIRDEYNVYGDKVSEARLN